MSEKRKCDVVQLEQKAIDTGDPDPAKNEKSLSGSGSGSRSPGIRIRILVIFVHFLKIMYMYFKIIPFYHQTKSIERYNVGKSKIILR